MVRQDKPRIVQKLVKENNKIVSIIVKGTVKKLAGSGYVSMPKELIGKYVTVTYNV